MERRAWLDPASRWIDAIREAWGEGPWGAATVFLFTASVLTILANAWMADDAYITFRVVDNFIHGHGPVFNVGERVQAFTNPLMMLVMSGFSFVTREVYFTGLAVSVAASVAAIGILVFRVSRSRVASVLALAVLVASSSFVTYATSGLENCFIFLLAALFFAVYFDSGRYSTRSLFLLTLLFSLSILNRMDTALLLAPALAWAFVRNERVGWGRMSGAALLGMTPFVAWEAFALVYYGFPFPNTAYAKLNTGVPSTEYLVRAVWYFVLSFLQDPMVLLGTAAAVVAVLAARRAKTSVPLLGVILYLVYIGRIGGDFMRGRFLTAPLFVALLVFVAVEPDRWESSQVTRRVQVLALATLLIAQTAFGMIYDAMDFNHFTPYGVYNDRAIYFPASNLPANLLRRQLKKSPLVRTGEELRASGETPVVRATLGFTGYYAGPGIHIVDPLALSDALLARMPAVDDPDWQVGHMERYVPEGYLETLRTGRNVMGDRDLAAFYDRLSVVIRGPLFTRERFGAIRDLNTGRLDHLIDRQHYRYEVENEFDMQAL